MNILVLNGSPKGKYSITLQTVHFLQRKFANHSFEILNVGQRVKLLEKDFSQAEERLQWADVILFSYPVYTFIAPSQLHRFMELLKESGVDVSGKFASQLTTSKHFYDMTAHRYIQDNCADLGLKYVKGLSADMDDLLTEKGQKQACDFFRYLLWSAENDIYEPASVGPTTYPNVPVTVQTSIEEKQGDVVILTDCRKADTQLLDMIDRFRGVLPYKTRVINLWDFPFKGGFRQMRLYRRF